MVPRSDGIIAAMGYTREQLEQFRDLAVPDLVGAGLRLLFVGINPSLWTAATGAHFAHPGNRFWPALLRGGLIDRPVDPTDGMNEQDRRYVVDRGIGVTNLVNRATARADELSSEELRAGGVRLRELAGSVRPVVIAFAGITAYRTAFGAAQARRGLQEQRISTAAVWVVPNPSGLNAHETIDSLAAAYHEVGKAAGLVEGSAH